MKVCVSYCTVPGCAFCKPHAGEVFVDTQTISVFPPPPKRCFLEVLARHLQRCTNNCSCRVHLDVFMLWIRNASGNFLGLLFGINKASCWDHVRPSVCRSDAVSTTKRSSQMFMKFSLEVLYINPRKCGSC